MAAVEHDEAVGEAVDEAVGESVVLQPASCHLWSTRDCLDLLPLELAQVLLHSQQSVGCLQVLVQALTFEYSKASLDNRRLAVDKDRYYYLLCFFDLDSSSCLACFPAYDGEATFPLAGIRQPSLAFSGQGFRLEAN